MKRGLELTEGYKYPPERDDHTMSQLATDGSTLAGHLASLAPSRNPPQKQAAAPSVSFLT